MIEIHINNHLYLLEEDKYKNKKYNYTKAETMVFLLNKKIHYNIADLYSTYYTEMKINQCIYTQSITNKINSFGIK